MKKNNKFIELKAEAIRFKLNIDIPRFIQQIRASETDAGIVENLQSLDKNLNALLALPILRGMS